jgi:hypothetical protein
MSSLKSKRRNRYTYANIIYIVIDESGNGTYEAVSELISLSSGDTALLDVDGSSLLIPILMIKSPIRLAAVAPGLLVVYSPR